MTVLPAATYTGPTIEQTIEFIKEAHAGQTDMGGNPYWLHPVSVMNRLGPDSTLSEKLTALLHDIVEDTKYTAEDLTDLGYPGEVVVAVHLLSRPRGPDRLTYIEWIHTIANSGNRIAIKVKIADNEDNSDPVRIAQLPVEERNIVKRYERSLKVLRAVPL